MLLENFQGPYLLNDEALRVAVTGRKIPGTFILGHDEGGTFVVDKLGRAEEGLSDELRHYVDTYEQFSFVYSSTPKAAFETQCDVYHQITPGDDNKSHPLCPAGSYWKCPQCHYLD